MLTRMNPHDSAIPGATTGRRARARLKIWRAAIAWLLVVHLAMHLGACRLLVDVDGLQCETDEQCATLLDDMDAVCTTHNVCSVPENPFPPELACLADPPPELIVDASRSVQLTLYLADFQTLGAPIGVTLRVCQSRDVDCENPLLEDVQVDSDGKALLELPHGFLGYFESSGEGYVPALFYSDLPLLKDTTLYGPSLLTPALVQALASTGQEGIEGGTGILIVDVADCDEQPLEGVTASILGSGLTPFYFTAGLPDRMLKSTHISTEVALHNTPRAIAGFSNVEPGYASIETHLPDLDEPFGAHTVIMRPDSMTFLRITAGAPQ